MGKREAQSIETMYSKKVKTYSDGEECKTINGDAVPAICHCGLDIQLKGDIFRCKAGHVFGTSNSSDNGRF